MNLTAEIDPYKYGVSFSAKVCAGYKLDPSETLEWLIKSGFRRFRIMSYWNEHEKFIMNSGSGCEIIQIVGGIKIVRKYPTPYPPGDEDLIEISALQYKKARKGAIPA